MSEPPQDQQPSSGSSPSAQKEKSLQESMRPSGSSKSIQSRTEYPKLPHGVRSSFVQPSTDEVEVGNKRYDFIQMNEGFVGHRFRRSATAEKPTYINIDVEKITTAFRFILTVEMGRLLRDKGVLSSNEIQRRVTFMVDCIVQGCCLMIYLKMQELHFTLFDEYDKFAERYRVKEEFEIPLPCALCIQQLGLVKIASMESEVIYAPTVAVKPTKFLMDSTITWNLSGHNEAVDYMKSLGLRFAQVNPKVKIGSTWWLYRQEIRDGVLCITCPLPESNFTEAGAVVNSMFFTDFDDPQPDEIADFTSIGSKCYGIMMRNPRGGIQVSSFRALCNEDPSIW